MLAAPNLGLWRAPFLAVAVFGICGQAVLSQEVGWREDYNAARREAQDKGLPLILDFGTDNCFWCKKLDETTFRDPAIAAMISGRFVPLKVDARKYAVLTEALRIQSFPTVVLAAPDGKILNTLEGYMEPERFQEQLQQVLASVSSVPATTHDYDEASRAVASSDYPRAVALLKGILEDDRQRSVQAKARQLLADIEQQAAGRLSRAKQLEDKDQTADALETLTELVRVYAGTQAAVEGGQALAALTAKRDAKAELRTRRARELLSQARDDYRAQQYLCCMDRCELLISSYGDLAEGVEAAQLVAEIKNNPDWMRQACETLTDRLGLLYLSLAETWLKRGQPQEAAICLERVMQAFPGTRQAEVAQTRLAQLQGQPTRRADFKKP
jgi:uncharacterized protein YyaL (SSP411 family)